MAKKTAAKKAAKKVAQKKTAPAKVEAPTPAVKKPIPKADNCSQCRYATPIDEKRVTCRRYPSPPGMKHQSTMLVDGWCGEFNKG